MARKNYCSNPGLESYGTPPGCANHWNPSAGSKSGTVVHSRAESPDVVSGDYAQRIQYTGVAGDSGSMFQFASNGSAAGTFAESDTATVSAYLWGSCTGMTVTLVIVYGATHVHSSAITLTSTPTRYSVEGTVPAGTTAVNIYLHVADIHEGDVIDVYMDNVMIEKGTLGDYFDGSTANTSTLAHFWDGSEFLSTSTEDVYEPGVACITDVAVPLPLTAGLGEIGTCAELFNGTFAVDTETEDITVVASTDYHVSAYLYTPTVGDTCTITVETGTSHELAVLTEANADWVRYDVDASTDVGEVTMHLKFAFGDGATVVYVAGLLIEQTDTLRSYFDGSFAGCQWTGTEDASTSTTRWR